MDETDDDASRGDLPIIFTDFGNGARLEALPQQGLAPAGGFPSITRIDAFALWLAEASGRSAIPIFNFVLALTPAITLWENGRASFTVCEGPLIASYRVDHTRRTVTRTYWGRYLSDRLFFPAVFVPAFFKPAYTLVAAAERETQIPDPWARPSPAR